MTERALQLWWASVEDFSRLYDDLASRLPAAEQERAARLRINAARHRFVLARSLLRRQLGAALEIDPTALDFAIGDRGKPHLAFPVVDDPPHFNLSHSGNLVVLVVAAMEVGVDIESLREMPNAERMARRFFDLREQSVINALPNTRRDHAFLRIWTQKEAYLKATGLGVGMPLRQVETEPDPAKTPGLHAVGGDHEEALRWTLIEVEIPNAVCTVAARQPVAELRVQRITPADLDVW